MKNVIGLFTLIIFFSCQSGADKKQEVSEQDTLNPSNTIQTDSVSNTIHSSRRYAEGLADFANMEWVEYCLPLPTFEYDEVFEEDLQKGQHRFVHKRNKDYYFQITGMMRSDTDVSLDDYFANSIAEYEENGKIITRKSKMNSISGFYVQGYFNNKIYEERFTEIVWFRKEEVVLLESNYSIKDTAQWNTWLNSWVTFTSQCN